ncbi:diacylglycerol kinase family protein [Streptomyces sp. PSKA30]|uniref:diacylglycerol/lipid kinase family protein n=1 Tax=Streptomyces sp. PSKA30 TaxID=2874597 RepID=UPI0035B1066E
MSKVDPSDRARSLARRALLAAVLAMLVSLLSLDGSSLVLLLGAGLAVCAVGAWWFLAHRGALRVLGAAVLAVAAPVAVFVLFLIGGMWFTALAAILLWAVALGCALRAERRPEATRGRPAGPSAPAGGPPHEPGLGRREGGPVRTRRVCRGPRRPGAPPGAGHPHRVAELARNAVADEHDLPFLVISAGTRNHLAMDLGLDRADPSRCLDALTVGVEFRVDLGEVAGRAFVNTVSFGVYAEIVRRPEYRDAKAGTALDVLPDLLAGGAGERLDALADDRPVTGQQALLVSNNPYTSTDPLDVGRRPRLDRGELGVLGVRVDGATQAADLAVRGSLSPALTLLTSRRVEVTAPRPSRWPSTARP